MEVADMELWNQSFLMSIILAVQTTNTSSISQRLDQRLLFKITVEFSAFFNICQQW
jgi:hypothetical protein